MALTDFLIQQAFTQEAGDASSLADATEIRRWWNEGQQRLLRYLESEDDISWSAGDLEVTMDTRIVAIDRLDYDLGVARQNFRLFGYNLIVDNPLGATADGTARLYYWATRDPLVDGGTSVGSELEDYACIYYALHRFYRKLVSNRVHYARYSTLLGANAIAVGDLQAESDRLLQDFTDARSELPPLQPASFHTRRYG